MKRRDHTPITGKKIKDNGSNNVVSSGSIKRDSNMKK